MVNMVSLWLIEPLLGSNDRSASQTRDRRFTTIESIAVIDIPGCCNVCILPNLVDIFVRSDVEDLSYLALPFAATDHER
jgi:hypothetical protein